MIDFEVGLQKAIKLYFPNALISGCFFHFVKCLWEKAKKLHLCKKDKIKHTKILIFILKIIPFINIDYRQEIFDKIEDFYSASQNDNNYYKLIKYYKKQWIYNSYINYTEISQNEYLSRTNNYLENFHRLLNESIEVYHPKISYLIHKYKEFLKSIYSKIKDSLLIDIQIKKEKFSIIEDILNFISNYNHKYKTNLNIHNIIQGE